MDKLNYKKNRLDLEYHGETQKVNAFLILLTTGVLSFIGNFIWVKDGRIYGFFITTIVIIIGSFFYFRSHKRMKIILYEIENLK